MPPLRERIADLPALVSTSRGASTARSRRRRRVTRSQGATPAAVAALCAYSWPGNIRELRNVIFEALVHKRAGRELLLSDLPRRVLRRDAGAGAGVAAAAVAARAPSTRDAVARAIAERRFDLRRAVGELERSGAGSGAGGLGRQRGGRGPAARRASDAATRTIPVGPCAP